MSVRHALLALLSEGPKYGSDTEFQDGRQRTYRLTEIGRAELMSWLGPPPDTGVPPRDELVIKVLVALRVPGVDVVEPSSCTIHTEKSEMSEAWDEAGTVSSLVSMN